MTTSFDDPAAARRLRRMRLVPLGLLFLMAVGFALTLAPGDRVWVGYVHAFCEAAMVGALADWFAVVALFRHPLGIPIPHTAIIQRRKDEIGAALARFLERHFLSAEVLKARLARYDIVGLAADWLQAPGNAERLAAMLGRWFGGFLDVSRDPSLRGFLGERAVNVAAQMNVPAMFGRVIELAITNRHHEALLTDLFRYLATALPEHSQRWRAGLRDDRPWWLPGAIDRKLFDEMVDRAQGRLAELAVDDQHALRQDIETSIATFARSLQDADESAFRDWLNSLEGDDGVQQYVEVLWDELAGALADQLEDDASPLRVATADVLRTTAQRLSEQPATREALNQWLREWLCWALANNSAAITRLVQDTIVAWDGATAARRIELAVGRDLQFIRINGTLVGGLVGLGLHGLVQALGP